MWQKNVPSTRWLSSGIFPVMPIPKSLDGWAVFVAVMKYMVMKNQMFILFENLFFRFDTYIVSIYTTRLIFFCSHTFFSLFYSIFFCLSDSTMLIYIIFLNNTLSYCCHFSHGNKDVGQQLWIPFLCIWLVDETYFEQPKL